MQTEAAARLDKFFGSFSGDATPLLLLDYDGTLAPFRLDRFQARPWAGVRELLKAIQHQGRTRMAIVSGRRAGEIVPLLGLDPPLEVWGLHGAERLHPDGRRELEQGTPEVQRRLDRLRDRLRLDALGGIFEDKANGVLIHWRGASRQRAGKIEERARQHFEPLARTGGLSLLEFESGLELRAGPHKGQAVEAILAEAGVGKNVAVPVAFLGDDLSDEAAFRVVQKLRKFGLTVLVRRERRETAAELWLRPPTELKNFLKRWLQAAAGNNSVQVRFAGPL